MNENIISIYINRLKKAGLTFVLFFLLAPHMLHGQSRAQKIEAIFLYNFTQFVDWPSSAFSSPDAPFIIGIIGKNPFVSYLEETVKGEKIAGHPIIIQYYKDVKDIQNCEVLFINDRSAWEIKNVLSAVNDHPVLTVSDIKYFNRLGGMIRFFIQDNEIRLQINPAAATASGLTISSKLLNVAEIYKAD